MLDIGAHVGFFTLAAAKRVGRGGRVYEFEPAPETTDVLRRHVELNGWGDRVEVIRSVVADADGEVEFFVRGLTMAASLGRENVEALNPEPDDRPAAAIRVPSVTIDSFCGQRGVRPDVLKVDVEGAEYLVLRGARGVLLAARPVILCEVHPKQMENCGGSLPRLEQYLGDVGYRMTPLDEPNEMGIFHARLRRED